MLLPQTMQENLLEFSRQGKTSFYCIQISMLRWKLMNFCEGQNIGNKWDNNGLAGKMGAQTFLTCSSLKFLTCQLSLSQFLTHCRLSLSQFLMSIVYWWYRYQQRDLVPWYFVAGRKYWLQYSDFPLRTFLSIYPSYCLVFFWNASAVIALPPSHYLPFATLSHWQQPCERKLWASVSLFFLKLPTCTHLN